MLRCNGKDGFFIGGVVANSVRHSNLLEKGNLAKKGLGNGEIVLSRIVLAG